MCYHSEKKKKERDDNLCARIPWNNIKESNRKIKGNKGAAKRSIPCNIMKKGKRQIKEEKKGS